MRRRAFHFRTGLCRDAGVCYNCFQFNLLRIFIADSALAGAQTLSFSIKKDAQVNRIYFDAPAEAQMIEAGRTTVIRKAGFSDTVVWNPAAAKCATMADLEPNDYQRFICVEAATVGTPVQLAPGECWQGAQTIAA